MLINADLSTDAAPARHQSLRAEAGATAPQPISNPANGPATSQIDPSLQRLADFPAGALDADWEIQDAQAAGQAVEAAQQSMLEQPGKALAAQANQTHEDVLNLLQPAG